jgi:transposase
VVAVHDALAAPQLAAPAPVEAAYRKVVGALVAMLGCLNQQVAVLEEQLAARFSAHPDAAILRSQPGLGVVLGARVLAEFGDDPDRYATAKGRKAFAGTAPVTRSSGLRRVVVARAACNQRLVDACYLWGERWPAKLDDAEVLAFQQAVRGRFAWWRGGGRHDHSHKGRLRRDVASGMGGTRAVG